MKKYVVPLLLAGSLISTSLACGSYRSGIGEAIDTGGELLADLISNLRAQGQAGLDLALSADPTARAHPDYADFVDQVAKQREAMASRLFWHTDFGLARAAAEKSGRPILSLRLLGNLDDEYSCANSRLFREVLYPAPEVNRFLREHFILHWESVRPVPVITIDFGDGRSLRRTITGNSAHYVLDPAGRVIDALPGLYTAPKFVSELRSAFGFFQANRDQAPHGWLASRATFHQGKLDAVKREFETQLARRQLSGLIGKLSDPIEMSDLTPQQWAKLAENDAPLFDAFDARKANDLTVGKGFMESPLIEHVAQAEHTAKKRANLDKATAEDSVRNQFVFHRRVHEYFAAGSLPANVDILNQWVYTELFQMPDDDPWLGLHTPDHFTGLTDDGAR